jgi:hypothetical protein
MINPRADSSPGVATKRSRRSIARHGTAWDSTAQTAAGKQAAKQHSATQHISRTTWWADEGEWGSGRLASLTGQRSVESVSSSRSCRSVGIVCPTDLTSSRTLIPMEAITLPTPAAPGFPPPLPPPPSLLLLLLLMLPPLLSLSALLLLLLLPLARASYALTTPFNTSECVAIAANPAAATAAAAGGGVSSVGGCVPPALASAEAASVDGAIASDSSASRRL